PRRAARARPSLAQGVKMSVIDRAHGSLVHSRRVRVLAEKIADILPQDASVLDVGCGDGLLARKIIESRPDIDIRGVDVLVREDTAIPVKAFDGTQIPHGDRSFDVVMFVDVLHHTEDPMVLLQEARRVARRAIVIKDHTLDGFMAGPTLRFMDRVGNARHGVALPYNYWPKQRWLNAFDELGLNIELWIDRLGLYPWPGGAIFERSLHYLTRLSVGRRELAE
ncbi:MAG: class I SAM-dependent methyltransferase, partial [Pirellulales bacterium]|nr:class I SAM-dependent methyltransferase [Pirellulales bacterium]